MTIFDGSDQRAMKIGEIYGNSDNREWRSISSTSKMMYIEIKKVNLISASPHAPGQGVQRKISASKHQNWQSCFKYNSASTIYYCTMASVPELGHAFLLLWLHFHPVSNNSCFQGSKNYRSFTKI